MTHPDLFTAYPHAPGSKGQDTSRAAAQAVAPSAESMRAIVLRALRRRGPSTPEEIAVWTRLDLMSVRPRFSELKALGQIETNGETRQSRTGKRAKVWRIRETAQ